MAAVRLFALADKNVLVIEETSDGIYLYSFRDDGFMGDTWHESVEYAKEQAAFEFEMKEPGWRAVPEDIADLAAFARKHHD